MGDGRSGMGERVKEEEKGNMGETWEMITRRIIKKIIMITVISRH